MNNTIFKTKLKSAIIICFLPGIFFQSGCNEKAELYKSTDELVEKTKTSIVEISVEEFVKSYQEAGKEYVLIDVRQAGEFDEDNIPGSVNIPRGVIEFKVAKEQFWQDQFMYAPADTSDIIIYCKKGSRGALATKTLMELGYKNVKNLEGGYLAYESKQQKAEE